MNVLEIFETRFSVRNYTNEPVKKEDLILILEAGRIAPTAANRQPQKLIVVQSEKGIEKISRAANTFNATTAVIVCADKNIAYKRSYDGKSMADIDATIVTDHMMHQATELGLGTLWVTGFDPAIIIKEFDIPGHIEPVNILLIGYSSQAAKSPDRFNTERKEIGETVFYESF